MATITHENCDESRATAVRPIVQQGRPTTKWPMRSFGCAVRDVDSAQFSHLGRNFSNLRSAQLFMIHTVVEDTIARIETDPELMAEIFTSRSSEDVVDLRREIADELDRQMRESPMGIRMGKQEYLIFETTQ